jgi:hypothetical protein
VNRLRCAALALIATGWAWGLAASWGCGSSNSEFSGGGDDGSAADGLGGYDVAAQDSPSLGDGNGGDGGACQAPDMLIVLDRTLSMSAEPNGHAPPNTDAGHALSKWLLATDVVKAVTTAPSDQTIRFGLELFPLDPQTVTDAGATGHCVTLTQLLQGAASTNSTCVPAEIDVVPALGTGAQIASILDPETRHLCNSTPIASALETATAALKSIADPIRKQFVLLVTDGGETCRGKQSIGVAQALATAGIDTFVVGFGAKDAGAGGVNRVLLNDLACAGRTAANFSTACRLADGGSGYVPVTPGGPDLFFTAEDGAGLEAALKSIEGQICCGCVR